MRLWEILTEEGRVVAGVNTTCDVQPGEIARQAAKFGFAVTPEGVPTTVYTQTPPRAHLTKKTAGKRSPRRR